MITYIDDPISDSALAAMNAAVASFDEDLGITGVKITPEADHDGDPVVYVRTSHRLVKPFIVLTRIRELQSAVEVAAVRSGERRFVHFRHDFHDQQLLDTDR